MKKETDDEVVLLGILLGLWLFSNLIPFILGLMNAQSTWNEACFKPVSKIEYIFPGYQFGCYMGKPFGDKK